MTPAINIAKRAEIVYQLHDYEHSPDSVSYGLEAAEKLGQDPNQVFKTLVIQWEGGKLAVGIVPVCTTLNLKQMAKALGAKKAAMANRFDVEKSTGYVMGGVSPLGQKKTLPTVIDESALTFTTIYVSAGKRGLEIELSPKDLTRLTDAIVAPIGKVG